MKEKLQDVNAKFSRISDEEISQVLEIAHRHKWEHRAHPIFEVEKELLDAQLDADNLKLQEILKQIKAEIESNFTITYLKDDYTGSQTKIKWQSLWQKWIGE